MIDLRSDTLTKPDHEMLESILTASFGDAGRLDETGRGGDPTVNELEDYAAKILKKEAAAFLCSGTMGNSAALLTWCRPHDKVVIDKMNHTYRTEQFVFEPRFGQVEAVFCECGPDGFPLPESVERIMETEKIRVLQLENTHNAHGGRCMPLELHKRLYEIAKSHGAKVHLDGARLFNAALGLGVQVHEIAQYADSVMFCVSKGIGAPFGSLVCGDRSFIHELRQTQKHLGGGMRQAGVMAAPALYALKNLTSRLKEDHIRARKMADGLQNLKHLKPQEPVETNLVMLEMKDVDAKDYCERLMERGVLAGPVDENRVRLVLYRGISDEDVDCAVRIMRTLDGEIAQGL